MPYHRLVVAMIPSDKAVRIAKRYSFDLKPKTHLPVLSSKNSDENTPRNISEHDTQYLRVPRVVREIFQTTSPAKASEYREKLTRFDTERLSNTEPGIHMTFGGSVLHRNKGTAMNTRLGM